MSVQELVFKYTTDGAKAAQRADQKVRDSVRETGRVAEQQSGAVERWLTANKQAIQSLAAASLAAVGAIVSASPTMRAELSGVRTAFSLLADTIVRDVLPKTGSLATAALDVAKAYRDIPPAVRGWTSALITVMPLVAGAILGLGKLASVIGGLVPSAFALGKAFGVIQAAASGLAQFVAASTAATAAVGALIGVFGVWVLEVTGVLDAITSLGSSIRSQIGVLADFALAFSAVATGGIAPLVAAIGAFITGTIDGGLSEGVSRAKEVLGVFGSAFGAVADTISSVVTDALDWGANLVKNLILGIET